MATIGVLPIVWGGGQSWWFSAALLTLVTSLAIWQIGIWWMGDGTYRVRFSSGSFLFVVPLAIGFFQWLPLGKAVQMLCPAAAKYWADASAFWHVRAASLSLAPDATLRRCGLYLGCLIVFLVISSLARHRRYMVAALCSVALAAVGNAVRFYVQVFSEPGREGRPLTGTFLNRNHFGFMMTLGIMAVSGLLAIVSSKKSHHHFDSRNRLLDQERPQGVFFLLTFLMLFLIVAQALCLSRGAFLTSTIGLMAFWCGWVFHHFHYRKSHAATVASGRNRQMLLVFAILLGGALCIATPWILEALSERYATLLTADGVDSEGRLRVWRVSLKLFRPFGWFGVGLGGYGVAVQPLEHGFFPKELIVHAHSDFLELACEIGLPAVVFLMLLGGWLWKRGLHVIRRQQDSVYHWAGMASLVALGSCAAHEFVEYSLLAWPNAFAFTVMMAVVAACLRVHRGTAGKRGVVSELTTSADDEAVFVDPEEAERKLSSEARHRHHENFRRNRWRYRLGYLAFAIALLAVSCPLLLRNLISGIQVTRLLHANEELKAEDSAYHWGKSVQDYRQLLALADRGLQYWNSSRPKTLSVRAEVRRNLAEALEESALNGSYTRQASLDAEEAKEQRRLALADLAEACGRIPGYGDYAFQYARTLEIAVEAGDAAAGRDEVLAVYEWALSRQPGIADSVRAASDAYARAWLWAMRNRLALKAMQYRQRAIDGYLFSLELEYSQGVLKVLRLLRVPLEEVLAHVTSGKNQQSFFDSLLNSQDYPAAQTLLEVMEDSIPDSKEFSAGEWTCQLAKDKTALAELTGDMARQDEHWQEWRSAEQSLQNAQLAQYHALLESGKDWDAGELLRVLAQREMPTPLVAVSNARQAKMLGRPDEMVAALLPLVYYQECPSHDELEAALGLLAEQRGGAASSNAFLALRIAFLENVLILRQAQTLETAADREKVTMAVARLEKLYASLEDENAVHWIQEHLIAYYAGMGHEALGNLEQASADYRLALTECPNFLAAAVRLAQIAPEQLKSAEQELLKWQARMGHPIGFLARGLAWLDLDCQPDEIRELYDTTQCTFALLITDDIPRSQEWEAVFYDRRGRVFTKKLIDQNMSAKFLTARVGEVMLLKVPCQPAFDIAKGSRRKLADGDLTVKLGNARARVLRLRLDN